MMWSVVLGLLDAFARWHERRKTIRRLSRLEDRLLDDIGIARHEIEAVVRRSTGPGRVSSCERGQMVILPNGSLMDLAGGVWPRARAGLPVRRGRLPADSA